jgi:pimeloyl-ACP methyl ester carboxylesterase
VIVRGAGGVDIATTDHGGDGVALLLTHGMGGEQAHLDPLVRRLTPRFRVVTFDMRNHGASGEGEWTWPLVCEDIAAVRDHYGLDRPVVGGHSLGGMVGVLFAEADGGARGVVNIDGHGMGTPDQYVGMTPKEASAALARLRDVQLSLQGEPSAAIQAMMPTVEALIMFDHYAKVTCPQLVFNATAPDPMVNNVEALAWAAPLMAAYRAGLERDFAALATAHPSVEIETMPDAAHYLIVTHADAVADRIARFVSALPPTGPD